MLNRRIFAFSGLVLLLSGFVLFNFAGSHKKNTPLKNLLNQNEFRRIISYKKLKSLPIGTHLSSEELTEELFAKNLPQSKDELYAQLLANTKEDFKYGRTVEIDGWIFSKTVAEFSLLQYKMFGNQS